MASRRFGTISSVMKHMLSHALICGTLLAVTATTQGSADVPCRQVIGSICAGGSEIELDDAIARLRAADVVVLGEKHDNPAHHEWQARLIADIKPEGLALEMVPRTKENAANQARAHGTDLEHALDWANSGWPAWAMYAPLFDTAPKATIAGGGIARDTLRASVGAGAASAFDPGPLRDQLETPLPEDMQAAMETEQAVAHCGALPDVMLPGMVEGQRLRDAAFADAALRLLDQGKSPVVLIVGNGHARTDRGSPLYLSRAAPEISVVSVGILEAGNFPEGVPFDISIFAPKHDRGDPCAAFLKSREKSD